MQHRKKACGRFWGGEDEVVSAGLAVRRFRKSKHAAEGAAKRNSEALATAADVGGRLLTNDVPGPRPIGVVPGQDEFLEEPPRLRSPQWGHRKTRPEVVEY